ncbi:hypothetical protein Q3G72_005277 [Acer saccharum]|nr:hypothetical protein Q3G72_005277 [Acer saccharum]
MSFFNTVLGHFLINNQFDVTLHEEEEVEDLATKTRFINSFGPPADDHFDDCFELTSSRQVSTFQQKTGSHTCVGYLAADHRPH